MNFAILFLLTVVIIILSLCMMRRGRQRAIFSTRLMPQQEYGYDDDIETSPLEEAYREYRLAKKQYKKQQQQQLQEKYFPQLSDRETVKDIPVVSQLDSYSKAFRAIPYSKIVQNAVSQNKLTDMFINREYVQDMSHVFSKRIDPINKMLSDQKSSGRCWIFALLNILRPHFVKKYNLDSDFEFSYTYLFFFHKMELANFFLHNVAKLQDRDVNDRLLSYFMKEPIYDGGRWNMLASLIDTYGLIPKKAMRESYQSENTRKLNYFLKQNLRKYAGEIRERKLTGPCLEKYIQSKLEVIYNICSTFLGEPPRTFNWHYYTNKDKNKNSDSEDSDKETRLIQKLTPQVFAREWVGFDSSNYISCVNYPSDNHPYYHYYDIQYCSNRMQGYPTRCLNIPISLLVQLTKNSIDDNQAVWFGCDVGKYYSKDFGVLDMKAFDYTPILDISIGEAEDLSKVKERHLVNKMSVATHAMIFVGYNLDEDGNIDKWLVENSWGDNKSEEKGWLTMSSDWFELFVYDIIIDKKYLTTELRDNLDRFPIREVEPWGLITCEVMK